MRIQKSLKLFTVAALSLGLSSLAIAENDTVKGTSFIVESADASEKLATILFGESSVEQVVHEDENGKLYYREGLIAFGVSSGAEAVSVALTVEGEAKELLCLLKIFDSGMAQSVAVQQDKVLKMQDSGAAFDNQKDYRVRVQDLKFEGSRPILEADYSACEFVDSQS